VDDVDAFAHVDARTRSQAASFALATVTAEFHE
jgi:hypothetical protein